MLTTIEADDLLQQLRVVATANHPRRRDWWRRRLSRLPARELVWLDGRARAATWTEGPLGPSQTWSAVDLEHPDGLAAAAASLHPDGWLRERAVAAMRRSSRRYVVAFLALRTVDHVPNVRDAALSAVLQRTTVAEGAVCLPVLHALSRRRFGLHALHAYSRALFDRNGLQAAHALLDSADVATRRAAYAAWLEEGQPAHQTIWKRIRREADQISRQLLCHAYIAAAPVDLVRERLLHGGSVDGRLLALRTLDDADFDETDLRRRLLDRSSRVRDAARVRAAAAGLPVAQTYLRTWREGPPAIEAAAVLDGLRETGQHLDPAALQPCLSSGSARIRLAALRLLHTDPEQCRLLLGLLHDSSPKVTRAAAHALHHVPSVRYADLADAASSPQPWTRQAAWTVRRALGSWERVHSNLELITSADSDLANAARVDILAWLDHGAARTWTEPTQQQRAVIAAAVQSDILDNDIRRRLAFHAGLPQPALRWVDASDALGTEIAVHGQPGDILLYPTNIVAKRWVAHEYGFLPTLVAAALERLGQIRDASERSHSDKPFELGWWSA
ncbi:hypothetical protein [Haloechinothrix salitolerans]|uniref:HEAT repeat domain-containing protein n=1 Tax=Haloechinothrix salitolerans TaxID=926830 RepID=A0ABW2C7S2_9PSEU